MITVGVVEAMGRDPSGRRVLEGTDRQQHQAVFEPWTNGEAAMRQQSVIPHRDRLSEQMDTDQTNHHSSPREERGDQTEKSKNVNRGDRNDVPPQCGGGAGRFGSVERSFSVGPLGIDRRVVTCDGQARREKAR